MPKMLHYTAPEEWETTFPLDALFFRSWFWGRLSGLCRPGRFSSPRPTHVILHHRAGAAKHARLQPSVKFRSAPKPTGLFQI